jgi:hypothetical protein
VDPDKAAHDALIVRIARFRWSPRSACFIKELADTISGNIFKGRLSTIRCGKVNPGPF